MIQLLKLSLPFMTVFLRKTIWLVILPGLFLGGTTGGWTTPFTGSTMGSFLGKGLGLSIMADLKPMVLHFDWAFHKEHLQATSAGLASEAGLYAVKSFTERG